MPITLNSLKSLKQNNAKFSCLTAYDASIAQCIDEAQIEVILVGDSLGMVIQGHSSTIPVTIEDMIYHTKAVAKGSTNALIMADMPFMAAHTEYDALEAARRLLQAGAHIIKLEGGVELSRLIPKLKQQGVPVCAHLGLTPQAVNTLGGYKVQARQKEEVDQLLDTAKTLEASGTDIILIECIPKTATKKLYQQLKVPIIGIGAGPDCDGQILVSYDILGIPPGKKARFAKNYLSETNDIVNAFTLFKNEVTSGDYPADEHCFN